MSNFPRLDASAIVKAVVIAIVVGIAIGFIGSVLSNDSVVLHGFISCLGLLPNIICGYFAAAFAGRNEIFHGIVAGIALVGIVGLFSLFLVGLFSLFLGDNSFVFFDPLPLFLMIPLSAIGAVIRKRTK